MREHASNSTPNSPYSYNKKCMETCIESVPFDTGAKRLSESLLNLKLFPFKFAIYFMKVRDITKLT